MGEITGGELLARCLDAEGIEFIFGLPSPESDPLLAVLADHGMRLVPIRHEAAAAHMAEGLYKTTGKVAVVLGNPGPGTANLLPGVLTALHEGVPLVAITSQHRLGIVYPSTPATFQGQDQLDLFRPVVKWGGPIFEWSRIPEVVELAFRQMWNGRPGPVQLEIPAPVLYATGDESLAPLRRPQSSRSAAPSAGAAQLDDAASLLAAATHPLVIVGAGVDRADANSIAAELATILGCPLMSTLSGRAAASAEDPNYLLSIGPGGDTARREADVLLVAGSRIGNLDTPFDKYWGDPAGQQLIQIDIDPLSIGVTRSVTLGIIGEVREALAGIVERLSALPLSGDRDALARYKQIETTSMAESLEPILGWQGPGIHPAHALATVGTVFGSAAVYTVDGGNTSQWAYSALPPTRPRSYHSILELGMLGTAIPSAIGAKLAAPDREVVSISGDGAAGFNFMELQTAAREGIAITTVVMAEGSWTMEELNELDLYGRTFGTAQGDIRWDVVAQGLGCHGEYVDNLDDLVPALERAKAHDGPSVVCIRSDPDANRALPAGILARFFEVYSGPTDA